jgi:hypothetical protein
MKKIHAILCGVAMMGVCTFAEAQDRDTASTNYSERTIEQSSNTKSDDKKTNDAERGGTQSVDQQLQNDADALQKNFEGATIDKVGPNGEKLFKERGKYYYINEQGDKVKVKKSDVRDQSVQQP